MCEDEDYTQYVVETPGGNSVLLSEMIEFTMGLAGVESLGDMDDEQRERAVEQALQLIDQGS